MPLSHYRAGADDRSKPAGGDSRERCQVARLERRWEIVFAAMLLLVTGCAGPAPSGVQKSATANAQQTTATKVNLDEIFPPGPGRDLMLHNCQSCHTWTPIAILRMDKAAWQRNSLEHRERVEALNDEEFKLLYDYLASTFTPDRPVPKLPPELLESWTAY